MYITKLNLQNLKRLRTLDLDFTHDAKPRMWTVFVAENGACKTTLLQAIALAASGPTRSNQLADVPSLPDLRQPSKDVSIYAEFEFGERQRKLRQFPKGTIIGLDAQANVGLASQLRVHAEQSVLTGDSRVAPVGTLNSAISKKPLAPVNYATLRTTIIEEMHRTLNELIAKEKIDNPLEEKALREKIFNERMLNEMILGINTRMIDEAVDHQGFLSPLEEARSKSLPGWFVAGYGTQRQLPVPLSASELKDRVLNRLEPLFGKASLVGTGFANQFVDAPFFEPFIQSLKTVFVENQLLPYVETIELRGRGGVSQPGDLVRSHSFEFAFSGQKTKVPATWLSQGYQSSIAWIADLIGQMYLDLGEPVPLEDMEGMVLVDELDLHLHPSWQVRLIPVLKRVFPRMQFIVTTHSPMLLPALERHEIVMLRLDEKGDVIAESPPASPKLMTGSEIYSSFFNIQKLYPSELGDDLRRYTYLSSDPTRTDEEDAEMLRLQKMLTDAGLNLGLPPVLREMP